MESILAELECLQLDQLTDDWVQAAYYSEFLEFIEFPSQYENVLEEIDARLTFRKVMKAFSNWKDSITNDDRTWTSLSSKVPHRQLLALLAYYIDYGSTNVTTKESRNTAIMASRLYYKMLSIPGYKAYNIYHSQLFAHSLACLSFPKVMCENESKFFNTKELVNEVNAVIKELQFLVFDLRAIILSLQLNSSDMNFEDILSNLVDITGCAIVNKLNVDKVELTNVTRVIYELIDILVSSKEQLPNEKAVQLLFKCILPKLIAASVDCRNANNIVRASYVTYSGLMLSKYGKPALNGYVILLQHLCFSVDGLERAEVRSARVSLVAGLMSLLPKKSFSNIVKWLLKLSTTSKISHRQIALEMLANLLTNDPDETDPTKEANKSDKTEEATSKQEDSELQPPVTETDNSQDENKEALPDDKLSTDSPKESACDQNENMNDIESLEETTCVLLDRPQTVPYIEILLAVLERVNDVSSTLRTRALNIITDCLTNKRPAMKAAIQELSGEGVVGRVMGVGARCVGDERAAVRRAAVALVQALLQARPAVSAADVGILVALCRDASIIVRTSAITAIADLTATHPTDEMFDAFLAGPAHQLSDPETKIQEQVANIFQQLLMERFKKFSAVDNEDKTPWKFLEAITRHNMRRHLQKACTFLAKSSKCISVRLVDILSTQLGAVDDERDLQCLVMLTSVARHVDYSDVAFVLDYYYKLTDNLEGRDGRLLGLVTELIESWSSWVNGVVRTDLRDHLVRKLASETPQESRIACASLAANLDPNNLVWATELMQISERRALSDGDVEEWLRAADLSLVAPAPPSPALARRFLDALANPPPEWSSSQTGACVAGLGRLSVRSRAAATVAAPALASALQRPSVHIEARLNSLLALTDICTRYTCIVEPLLDTVCACVGAEAEPQLRRAAARALTRLLLAGYLRLRTPLYYRYCALLADEDHDVREPAEYYVTCCMTPDAIYHHFVDCVLHYNKPDSEKLSFDARQLIYDVMLQRLSLVQKLNVQCRLAKEILEHAAAMCDEGDGELSDCLNAALLDTITLLCGPRMKLPKKKEATGEQADIDDLQDRVRTNIVSHKMKRTVAEVVVPAVLRLHARLGGKGGQVAAYLVRIATDLLSDYRQEIEELIENDEELVEKVALFQQTIGAAPSFGNSRNLVTASAPPEPDTPRAPRRRAPRPSHAPPSKRRTLRL